MKGVSAEGQGARVTGGLLELSEAGRPHWLLTASLSSGATLSPSEWRWGAWVGWARPGPGFSPP